MNEWNGPSIDGCQENQSSVKPPGATTIAEELILVVLTMPVSATLPVPEYC